MIDGWTPSARALAIDAVDAALSRLEAAKDGAVHPIRTVPIDMIADAVARELLRATPGVRVLRLKTVPRASVIERALAAVIFRFDPPRQAEQGHPYSDEDDSHGRLVAGLQANN